MSTRMSETNPQAEVGKSSLPNYVKPVVTTYDEEKVLDLLGPARTYAGLQPTQLILRKSSGPVQPK